VPHPRRAIPAVLLAVTSATIAACGSSAEPKTIADFRVEAPELPPISVVAQAAADPAPARPATRPKAAARAPRGATEVAEGAPTDAEIAAELRQAFKTPEGELADPDRSIVDTATLSSGGIATIPPSAPPEVAAIIRAANQVATKPYIYGGGHGRFAGETWVDTGYDCSGSISYAFASAGLIDAPMVSGDLARWGKPGPGKWVTIYANGGHAWMTVGGLRFDTSGLKERGSRWQTASRGTSGFTVRHPPGL
jgi:cell wall-associated NlpC family hydrolase